MLKKVFKKMDEHFSLYMMAKVIGVLLILFLLIRTQSVWGTWVSLGLSILQPFFFGFVIAYAMNPLINFLSSKGINKNLSIALLWTLIIIAVVILIVMLFPVLYTKINEFILSLINGVQWISDKIKTIGNLKDFSLVNSLTESIVNLLQTYDDWIPSVVSSLPAIMSSMLGILTNILFTIIIAIYMLFDFERIKGYIRKMIQIFFKNCNPYLHEININVTVYLKSMIILIIIRFVEYSAFYFCVGHKDWVIIGIISAVGALIPYIGGTVANAIGLLTALTLPMPNLIALIIGILILSNVDNYVISPIVHEKRSALGPLLTLFAVFAGGIIYNIIGIMLSVPLVIAVKSIMEIYREQQHDKVETDS